MTGRSRSGCISCRIRHVKCDETRPHCQRCLSAKRVCDGYLDPGKHMSRRKLAEVVRMLPTYGPASQILNETKSLSRAFGRPSLPKSQLSTLPFMVIESDITYFDHFRSATAPSTDAFIPSGFWRQDLLQLAHTEPALWHATSALGALHRRWEREVPLPSDDLIRGAIMHHGKARWEREVPLPRDDLVRVAIMHYGKALAFAKQLDTPEKLLALSLPLIATANMLGFWKDSHAHIFSALKLLPSHEANDWSDAASIGATLTRLDLQSMTFSDSACPYPFNARFALNNPSEGILRPGGQIQTYSQASSILFILIRQEIFHTSAFEEDAEDAAIHAFAMAELKVNVRLFENQMAELEARPAEVDYECASISIRIYHTWLRVRLRTAPLAPQTANDANLAYFERIVVLCRAFLDKQATDRKFQLSLELALIAPLFEAAKRCRHPRLRRAALHLLRTMNRQEGMWRSDGVASAAEILIAKEEGIPADEEVSDDREGARISDEVIRAALRVPWSAWSEPGFELGGMYSWAGVQPIAEERRVRDLRVLSRFDEQQIDIELVMSVDVPDAVLRDTIY